MNELRQLMSDYKLTTDDVVRITERKKQTVQVWLSKDTKRPIPKDMLKILKLTVGKGYETNHGDTPGRVE